MDKEFVPHTEALALKELGFNEPCFGYYYTLNGKDWKLAEKSEYYRLDDEINIGGKFSLLAPTFSQAFRWFREKYKLSGIPTHQSYDVWNIWNLETGECFIEEYPIESYEDAELACLIKLIEIVKGGNK
jgi:hypothetical protein